MSRAYRPNNLMETQTGQTPEVQPTPVGVGSGTWLASFHRGNWVKGWVIEDPYGERDRFSFARTRKEAWEKFCAPAMDYPRCVPALRRDGFKAVKMRARSKAHAFMHGRLESSLANGSDQPPARG